ncbi:uncharacterized protein AB675_4508 [Cyphellophora attinorum]|uniref:F-box domain-containing protein n=1 Tax=Cyphellophora attinorum TaxID=1664694 RepID=A0A0N1H876_9EURO|nr:uncharacterized protein AB675_4508 [Phialophora attinorum]KPI39205.1 hypothetical protein AB675_4508 [Phialophora attinorum]
MPERVTLAEVVELPQYMTYAQVLKSGSHKSISKSRNILVTANQYKSESTRGSSKCLTTALFKNTFQDEPLGTLTKLPNEIIVKILEYLVPRRIEIQVYTCRDRAQDRFELWWSANECVPQRFPIFPGCFIDRNFEPICRTLLRICKDLSVHHGPMMYSRVEVVASNCKGIYCRHHTDIIANTSDARRERRERCERAHDMALSSLHRNMVERFDSREWVDGADRDHELGLFRARV